MNVPRGENMRFWTVLAANLLLAGASSAGNGTIDAKAAFARLKTLAGQWEAQTDMGKAQVSYEIIAGGTALVEHENVGDMPAMITVYHLDGNRLMLTHYCMAGNQPRMQAQAFDPATGELQFRFLDATNLSPGAGHMHNATFHLTGTDRFASSWEFYQDGKLAKTQTVEYARVK
jgi:hypothetical protein